MGCQIMSGASIASKNETYIFVHVDPCTFLLTVVHLTPSIFEQVFFGGLRWKLYCSVNPLGGPGDYISGRSTIILQSYGVNSASCFIILIIASTLRTVSQHFVMHFDKTYLHATSDVGSGSGFIWGRGSGYN